MCFPPYVEEMIRDYSISVRETCPHWIEYEILDALPEKLKKKYVNRFNHPQICLTPPKITVKIKCTDKSGYGFDRCDCSSHYPKTCEKIKEIYDEMCLEASKKKNKR